MANPQPIVDSPSDLITFKSRLDEASGKGKRAGMRRTAYFHEPTRSDIYSYAVSNEDLYKKGGRLPSNARGLFLRVREKGPQIVARGYDKFFNAGEVKWTEWPSLTQATRGPYELTLKENGCIIFVCSIDGQLLVTSKHSLDNPHSQKGQEWLEKHLANAGRTPDDLAQFLGSHNVTAVFELVDDDFEEHILEYPPERAGLYLHGINYNTIKLRTWPSSELMDFAVEFGVNKVGALIRDDLKGVKELTDSCRETGSFESRPIEGWVVRCKTKGEDRELQDMFFKVKYDEPYLMYREWREVTRMVLKDKDFSKYRYDLTSAYVEFARKKLKSDPELFEGFNENHGIIRLRNLFLEEQGIKNPEEAAGRKVVEGEILVGSLAPLDRDRPIDRPRPGSSGASSDLPPTGVESRASSAASGSESALSRKKAERGSSKTLIVPVATIGSGKTTIALALTELFGFGHVQNDNITSKKNPMKQFCEAILTEFKTHDTVFADKNNHLSEHREKLIATVTNHYPGCRIVALEWDVDPKRHDEILEFTVKRVMARGENHQSLTPGTNAGFRKVLSNFIRIRHRVDLKSRADKGIDQLIPVPMIADTRNNLLTVIREMGLQAPSDEAIDRAMAAAFTYAPTVKKVVDSGRAKKGRTGLPRYFGLTVEQPDLGAEMDRFFSAQSAEDRKFWDELSSGKRIKTAFHVTLVYCGGTKEMDKAPEWKQAIALRLAMVLDAEECGDEGGEGDASNAEQSGVTLASSFTASRVVWDGRVMCMPVDDLPSGLESENTFPHVTLGTANDDIKAVASNALLEAVADGKGTAVGATELWFDEPVRMTGRLKAFWF